MRISPEPLTVFDRVQMLYAVGPPALGADGYRWRSKYYHLTYAGHIDKDLLLAKLRSITTTMVLGTSIVHESSDSEAPYDHTHFAWLFKTAVDLRGSRIMDIQTANGAIHPHILTKKSVPWMAQIFTKYHCGHKAGSGGGFVAPVAGPWQNLPQCFEFDQYTLTEVAEAPDLMSGVLAAGVTARSVSDVLLLQNAKRPPPFDHNFAATSFLPLILPPLYAGGHLGTLHIYGPIRLGKTEWACAQFENPLLVTTRDALRDFIPNYHDGIVLDKMLFNDWTVTDCESLTDYTQPATIKVRYGNAKIPKRTRKIVVTNEKNAWPSDPHGQLVGRRVSQLHITSRTY